MNILLFFYSSTSFFISTASATINNNYNFISFFRIIKLINKKRYFLGFFYPNLYYKFKKVFIYEFTSYFCNFISITFDKDTT